MQITQRRYQLAAADSVDSAEAVISEGVFITFYAGGACGSYELIDLTFSQATASALPH